MGRFFCAVILVFFSLCSYAQTDTLVVVGDSLINSTLSEIKTSFDSTRGERLKKVSKNFVSTSRLFFGVDSLTGRTRPRITFLRSMLVPGWGQFMNKDYWKLPIVYGAAAGGVIAIRTNNERYNYYLEHVEILEESGQTSMPPLDNPGGIFISKETYARAASSFKRYRDLSIIGFALGWTLFAVEANVTAHLKTFDISDDISLRWSPTVIPGGGTYTAGVKLSLNFK